MEEPIEELPVEPEPALTPEETPEPEVPPVLEKPEEPKEDIDYKKQLEALEKKPEQELEKAKRALFFNAQRLKELGGTPEEVLGIKKPSTDLDETIERKFAERDARNVSKSEDEFKLLKWYMDNKGLSVEEAHLLANKGRILRSLTEVQRANIAYAIPSSGRRVESPKIPDRSPDEKKLLERRGLRFNPKTGTYQGKIYEEYFDQTEGRWVSRKLK